MANSDLSEVLNKLASLETKLTTVESELSAVKLDQQRLHDFVTATNFQMQKQPNFPRLHELRFPEYDGTVDPDSWIHRCELFFRLQRTDDGDKAWLAGFHMTGSGKALICYSCCWNENDRNGSVSTWPKLAESVRRWFARGGSFY